MESAAARRIDRRGHIASKNNVNLRRESGGKVEIRNLPVADIAEGRSPNVVVLPGDVVVVDERIF